jgi:hypothetical protein
LGRVGVMIVGLLDAVVAGAVHSKGDKKGEWGFKATYISGHPEIIGQRAVVIWVYREDGMVIRKVPLVYGKGDMLFKIPYNKVVSISGDGTLYPDDTTFTTRRLTVTVSGEDKNGEKYDVPIAFNIAQPWISIPKIIGLTNRSRGIKI